MHCCHDSQDDNVAGPSILLCSPFTVLPVIFPRTNFPCPFSAALPQSHSKHPVRTRWRTVLSWGTCKEGDIWSSVRNKWLSQPWNVSAATAFKTSWPLYYEGYHSILRRSPPLHCHALVLGTCADWQSLKSFYRLCSTPEHLLWGHHVCASQRENSEEQKDTASFIWVLTEVFNNHFLKGRRNKPIYLSLSDTCTFRNMFFFFSPPLTCLCGPLQLTPPLPISVLFSGNAVRNIPSEAQSPSAEDWQLHSHLCLSSCQFTWWVWFHHQTLSSSGARTYFLHLWILRKEEHRMAQNRHPICSWLTIYWFHCQHSTHKTGPVITPPLLSAPRNAHQNESE